FDALPLSIRTIREGTCMRCLIFRITAITAFLLQRRARGREGRRELARSGELTGLCGVGAGELLRLFAGGGGRLGVVAGGWELFSPGLIASSLLGSVVAGAGLRETWISATAPQQTAAEGLIDVYDGRQLLLFGFDQVQSRRPEVTLGE